MLGWELYGLKKWGFGLIKLDLGRRKKKGVVGRKIINWEIITPLLPLTVLKPDEQEKQQIMHYLLLVLLIVWTCEKIAVCSETKITYSKIIILIHIFSYMVCWWPVIGRENMCFLDVLPYNIYIRFGNKVYIQVVDISLGTNCVPLIVDLFLYCLKHNCSTLMLLTNRVYRKGTTWN